MPSATYLHLSHNVAEFRYEARRQSALAGFAAYRQHGNTVTATHTEVLPAYEGQGVGSAVAKFLLDDLRARRLTLVPACRFIAAYVQRHDEYADLLA